MKQHYSHTYCTSNHSDNLYQTSTKTKGNEVEMNFINGDGLMDLTHLDVSNFFENPSRKIDHINGDRNVCYH